MNDQQLLKRITTDSDVMAGKPVIKGTRLTIEFILNQLAHGMSYSEIREEYNGVTDDDIRACLLFAQKSLENTSFMPLVA